MIGSWVVLVSFRVHRKLYWRSFSEAKEFEWRNVTLSDHLIGRGCPTIQMIRRNPSHSESTKFVASWQKHFWGQLSCSWSFRSIRRDAACFWVTSQSQWRQCGLWCQCHSDVSKTRHIVFFPNFPTTGAWESASFYDFTKNGVLCCSEASFGCYIRISKGPSDNKSVHRRRNRDRLLHLYDACLNRNGFRSLKGISGSGQSARKGFVSSQPWFVWDLVICKTWGNGISKQMRKVRESERESERKRESESACERGGNQNCFRSRKIEDPFAEIYQLVKMEINVFIAISSSTFFPTLKATLI